MDASKRQREREEQEKKELRALEKKMIADGYKKEYVLKNPNSRYRHEYRKISKQMFGLLIITLSFIAIASFITALFILGNMSSYWLIPVLISCITFSMGTSRFYNKEYFHSASDKAEPKEGYYYVSTEDIAWYGDEWVKKDKKK